MEVREMSFAERMTEKVELGAERAALVKQSYLMLSLAVIAAMFGGWAGSTMPFFLNLFSGWTGWIVAMLLLNFLPAMAMRTAHNPTTGLLSLLGFGFVAGLVLGPMIYVVAFILEQPELLFSAGVITAAVFGAVTFYVFTSGKSYSAPRGMMVGMFIGLAGAVPVNIVLGSSLLGFLISLGIGVFGVVSLFYSTSDLLHNRNITSPITGAVMLFSGVFMIFQAVLRILMAFAGGSRN